MCLAADGSPRFGLSLFGHAIRKGSELRPSPSTRAAAAEGGAIWLFGSDGGVAQVTDTFQAGQCPEGNIGVRYDPIFRRDNSGLPVNTVPALVMGADGTLWFGTALASHACDTGSLLRYPSPPPLCRCGAGWKPWKRFFQEVAEAIS